MNSETISATVPTAFIEYRLNFVRSILEKWRENPEIIQALLETLRPWNVHLSNVSIKQAPTNLGELQITFEIIRQRVVFNLFLEAASLFATNVGWGDAPNLRKMVEAIQPSLVRSANVEVANIQATLAFHITPRGKDVRQITKKFAPPGEAVDESVTAFGFSIYRGDSSRVVDLSLLHPNSLFVRMIRNFEQSVSLNDIEAALRSDQASILDLIGLRID
jgi:hypothetical protein